ncbi:hypothetical protein F5X98DRAFT_378359 [Xylaria grammica]|nr:hypothetical protein F5X98DRAFT_378359 [Xylaria grammica]
MDEHRSQDDNRSMSQSSLTSDHPSTASINSPHTPPNPPALPANTGALQNHTQQRSSARLLPPLNMSSAEPATVNSQQPTSAAANPRTQTSLPTTTAAGPAPATATATATSAAPSGTIPTAPIPPQQPASSAHPGTNPAAPPFAQAQQRAAHPPQHPARPPTAPWGYPSYPAQNPNSGGPFNMAAPNGCPQPFCVPPPHMQQAQQQQQIWYYYPGTAPAATAGLPMTCTPTSPWWSGTAHYLTNPPPQPPQVYTVEPAYIMPQAGYYQAAAAAPGASPVYYYVPGAAAYYYA